MPLSHHPLITEFPEYKDAIHELKLVDGHFQELMEKYEELDKHIYRIEDGSEPSEDAYVEELKKERLAIKDDILQVLRAQS